MAAAQAYARPYTGIAAPLVGELSSDSSHAITPAIWAGLTHLSKLGLRHRRAVAGRVDHARQDHVAADAVVLVLGRHRLRERDHRRLRGDVAGGAAERLERGARADAHDRPATAREQMRHRGLPHQIRRPQVQPELLLELLDRRLVHARAHREPADQVDDAAQRGLAGAGRPAPPRTRPRPRRTGPPAPTPARRAPAPARARSRRSRARPPASRRRAGGRRPRSRARRYLR